jgi:hypothetical protein
MKKILYILILIITVLPAMAQQKLVSYQYSVGFGTGDLHSFINPVSFRGITFDYKRMVKPDVALGVEFGLNTFFEKKDWDTYNTGNFSYSGKQYRYSNNLPMLFTIGYYKTGESKVTPYADLGIGTMYVERRTDFGSYSFSNSAWQFVMRPELGIIIKSEGASVILSSKYYYGIKVSDLPSQSYFTINIGLVIN